MARYNLEALLKKKKWTGKEVGIACIRNIQYQAVNGKSLFPNGEITRMIESLDNEKDIAAYNVYRNIISTLREVDLFVQAYIQQFFSGYYRYKLYIKMATDAERVLKNDTKRPLILTRTQYNRIIEEIRATNLKNEIKLSMCEMVVVLTATYIGILADDKAEVPEEIAAALFSERDIEETDADNLAYFCKDIECGHYTLPTGETSNDMGATEFVNKFIAHVYDYLGVKTKEEFVDAVDDMVQKLLNEAGLHVFHGTSHTEPYPWPFQDLSDKELLILLTSYISDTDEEDDEKRYKKIWNWFYNSRISILPFTYDDKPDVTVSRFDMLNSKLFDEMIVVNATEQKKLLKKFKAEHGAVYEAIINHINKMIPDTAKLKAQQFTKELYTVTELIEQYGFKELEYMRAIGADDIAKYFNNETDNTSLLKKRQQASMHSVAIIEDPVAKGDADKEGNYVEPEEAYFSLQSIDKMLNDEESCNKLQEYQGYLILDAFHVLNAYNDFIDILADVYSLDFLLDDYPLDFKYQDSLIQQVNNELFALYADVYGTEEEKERKRKLLIEHCQPLDRVHARCDARAKEDLRKSLVKLGLTGEASNAFYHWRSLFVKLTEGTDPWQDWLDQHKQ